MAYVGEYPPGVFARPKEQRRSRKLRLSPLRLGEQIYREKLARLRGWPVTAILFFFSGLRPRFSCAYICSNFAKKNKKLLAVYSTLTPHWAVPSTSINLASRSQTQNLFHLNFNLHLVRHAVKQEKHINRGKTLSPDGINRKDERWTEPYQSLYCIIIYLPIMPSIVLTSRVL